MGIEQPGNSGHSRHNRGRITRCYPTIFPLCTMKAFCLKEITMMSFFESSCGELFGTGFQMGCWEGGG